MVSHCHCACKIKIKQLFGGVIGILLMGDIVC